MAHTTGSDAAASGFLAYMRARGQCVVRKGVTFAEPAEDGWQNITEDDDDDSQLDAAVSEYMSTLGDDEYAALCASMCDEDECSRSGGDDDSSCTSSLCDEYSSASECECECSSGTHTDSGGNDDDVDSNLPAETPAQSSEDDGDCDDTEEHPARLFVFADGEVLYDSVLGATEAGRPRRGELCPKLAVSVLALAFAIVGGLGLLFPLA